MQRIEKLNAELKSVGLKVTHPRITVLRALKKNPHRHLTAEDMYRVLLEQDEDIGLATVYRVLNQFEEAGIVERHHFESGKGVFELSSKQHHDHLVCLDTGDIIEFSDDVIDERLKEIANKNGMRLIQHSLNLYGELISEPNDEA